MKRAKKEIMAMVIAGMKGDKKEPAKHRGSNAEQASETLLALVRGERKKSASSMISVDLNNSATDFVPSGPKPKGRSVLMIPRQGMSAEEFRPVNRRSTREKEASSKQSGVESNDVKKVISQTENDNLEKINLTKTDPLSIKKGKRETFKKGQRQDPEFSCDLNCKFRGKDLAFEPGVLGSGSEDEADPDDRVADRRAEEKIDSWINYVGTAKPQ